jgi:hypothetical protein
MARSERGGGAKSSKKNRKFGRNSVYCTMYKNTGRQEKNKQIKLERHLKKYPNDLKANGVLQRIKAGVE